MPGQQCPHLVICLLGCIAIAEADDAAADPPSLQSSRLDVVLDESLDGFQAIRDRTTDRDFVQPDTKPLGLYRLTLGGGKQKTIHLTSLDATERSCKRTPSGLQLRFVHEGETPLEVLCRATTSEGSPDIRWRIAVQNGSRFPLTAAEFPRVQLTAQLGSDAKDDAIVYPSLEGVLLTSPALRFRDQQEQRTSYPGKMSAQFMYFFDPQGGFYVAAEDSTGYRKDLVAARRDKSLELTVTHRFPRELETESSTEYDIVWTTAGGSWQSGASIYRDWAERRSWCSRKLTDRDVPPWLLKTNVFLNFSVRAPGIFSPAEAAKKTFARYRELFGAPLVATAFSWERHGSWIGPEYFPPFGGEQYYKDLAADFEQHGDHLQVYLSGFRWGVRKPVSERKDQSRVYTDYDGTKLWEERGREATAITAQGDCEFIQPPWADNYTLCAGSDKAQELLAEGFRQAFAMGVTGVDLDQNIGADAAVCFSTEHGHAPGTGLWQHEAVVEFLDSVRREAKSDNPDRFVGVEEPCEAYIPWLDAYHGRAFTDTRWPALGPGCVSIPLYIYLYHEYQIGYAGWIDRGFSPMADERVGLGRAFLFGMQPGVRVNGGSFQLGEKPSEPMEMLVRIVRLMQQAEEYLLLGRMLDEPKVQGAGRFPASGKNIQGHPPLPIEWPLVQATSWRASDGSVAYALANLSSDRQTTRLTAAPNGTYGDSFVLTRLDPDAEHTIAERVSLPHQVELLLEPWAVCLLKQTAAK
jgi:uncharacterized protein DUF6259